MPLYLKDDRVADSVTELARRLHTTKQDPVKTVVEAELDRMSDERTFDERLRQFHRRFPKPAPTGLQADKVFYDDLSGEVD